MAGFSCEVEASGATFFCLFFARPTSVSSLQGGKAVRGMNKQEGGRVSMSLCKARVGYEHKDKKRDTRKTNKQANKQANKQTNKSTSKHLPTAQLGAQLVLGQRPAKLEALKALLGKKVKERGREIEGWGGGRERESNEGQQPHW